MLRGKCNKEFLFRLFVIGTSVLYSMKSFQGQFCAFLHVVEDLFGRMVVPFGCGAGELTGSV